MWIVDDDGPADFRRIQDAINAASEGDVIYIKTGKYYGNITIRKPLKLLGEEKLALLSSSILWTTKLFGD
jgi:pectin methylesterase-like acyl-CoA thioesterase